MTKTIVITGVTGQDGSILASKYLDRDYKVYGLIRRNSSGGVGCLSLVDRANEIELLEGDLTDLSSLVRLCRTARPNLFINAGAQSHVGLSFDMPDYTIQATGHGVVNCLEAIRISGCHSRFLQLSSSEMFGGVGGPQDVLSEDSPMVPKSPYATAKLLGYHITKIYRESYSMHASNSICFNHEEPGRRGKDFVTRKITLGIANIKAGNQSVIKLGNLDAKRDWGMASDYCEAMMLILDHTTGDDYVIATGKTWSIKDFLDRAFARANLGDWSKYIEVDSSLYRPNEVHTLIGNYSKIKNKLGWSPKHSFDELVNQMVDWDLKDADIDPLENHEAPGIKVLHRVSPGCYMGH